MFFKFCELCVKNTFNTSRQNIVLRRLYHAKVLKKQNENVRPLISCRRKEFDFFAKQQLPSLEEIPYASKGWQHKKSKGDYFILHMSDEPNMFDDTTFAETGLKSNIIEALKTNNILKPTIIQSKSIPPILSGKNSLIAAETGCGKTLAYLLPAVDLIMQQKQMVKSTEFNSPFCLILTPSRELALQIHNVAENLLNDLDIKTNVIIGGSTKRKMLNPHFTEMDILVATPGAFSKLTTAGVYKTNQIRHVVLDEADTLLDESFSERISFILKRFPFSYHKTSDNGVQLTLASATMPVHLPDILHDIIIPDSLTKVTTDNLHKVIQHVPQRFLRIGHSMKPSQLLLMVKNDLNKKNPVIIFSNTIATCDWISMFLNENGVKCINLNGNIHLYIRKNKFREFQTGDIDVISCTDIGSRGLDTTRVKHVINYDFPKHTADYLHRCGRTGRIGSPKMCHVTNFIANQFEISLVQKIELAVRKMQCLPSVNANISGMIKNKIIRQLNEQ